MADIKIRVQDYTGEIKEIEAPTDMNLSLMELLKANEYPVLATCGGMALCATCHVKVEEGFEKLSESGDNELDMIDTLPNAEYNSRLACQLRLNDAMDGMLVRLAADENDL
ncbi:ferredoxin [Marivirga lumbricoides]|uniref:Ferredoxin n=1 Tax=Marivirga lumbricoides TaxID=1046115 RepID=A0A2T4DSV2_9BACT|nr:ferredoxin [Marivirga lumbricoides]GGC22023.1 ferredoxin [Marivirga lumbricoides]